MSASQNPMSGGLWNTAKPTFSAQTQNLLKVMMQESKLTNFQQRTLKDSLKRGESLPPRVGPSFSHKEKEPVVVQPPSKIVNARKHKIGLRNYDKIVDSGAYEKPDYKPRPTRALTDKEKDRLANMMAYGKDFEKMQKMAAYQNDEDDNDDEPAAEKDRFEELQDEIKERKNFLDEMDSLGKGKEYRHHILTEISQKIREMEIIDKKRTEDLKRLMQNK